MTVIRLDTIKAEWLTPRAQDTYVRIIRPIALEDLSLEEVGVRIGMTRREVARRRREFEEEVAAQQLGAVLPDLRDDEYEAVKATVVEYGKIFVPAIRNKQTGNLLDGNHRERIAKELDIELPVIEVDVPVEKEREVALAINVARRQLDRETVHKVVEAELLHDPTQSDRAIAERVGISHVTVGAARKRLLKRAVITDPEKRVGKDGKAQSATKQSSGGQVDHLNEEERAECEVAYAIAAPGRRLVGVDEVNDEEIHSADDAVAHEVGGGTLEDVVRHVERDLLALLMPLYRELPEEWRREEIDELLGQLEDAVESAARLTA